VSDYFQVAHFEANQIAFSHVVEIRRSGDSATTSPFLISGHHGEEDVSRDEKRLCDELEWVLAKYDSGAVSDAGGRTPAATAGLPDAAGLLFVRRPLH